MKKLLLILMFLLLPCMVFGQIFDVGADLGFGWLTEWESYIVTADVALYINPDGKIGGTLYGGVEVLMGALGEGLSFCPYSDRYSVGAVINVSIFYAGVEHYCIHPVWSYQEQFDKHWYVENCTKIMAGISWQMPHRVKRRGKF